MPHNPERDQLTEPPASQWAFMAAVQDGTAFAGDGRAFRAGFDAALAGKLQTVTTAAELGELPVGSIIIDSDGDACQKCEDYYDNPRWYVVGQDFPLENPSLPATILHVGGAK